MPIYKIQSVIFDSTKWTIIDAANYLLNNDFDVIEIDESDNYIIFKQIDESVLKELGYTVYKKVRLDKSGIEMIQVFKPFVNPECYTLDELVKIIFLGESDSEDTVELESDI